MPPQIRRQLLALTLGFILAPLVLLSPMIWMMNAHGVSMSRYARLEVGMSTARIRDLLGKPKIVSSDDDGSQRWIYDRHTWCGVVVSFSPEGRVTEFDHDH